MSLSASVVGLDDEWETEASVIDLGIGGAGLLVRRELGATVPARLVLVSPNRWDPLVLEGTIRWTRAAPRSAFRAGLAFTHRSGSALRGLIDLIASTAYE